MALDLLRWGEDLISEPADYIDDLFSDELNGVSDSDDVGARTTPKGSFLLIYRSVLSVTTTQNRTNLLVAPKRDLVKSKGKVVKTTVKGDLKFLHYINFTKCERESRNLNVRKYKCEKCRIGKNTYLSLFDIWVSKFQREFLDSTYSSPLNSIVDE